MFGVRLHNAYFWWVTGMRAVESPGESASPRSWLKAFLFHRPQVEDWRVCSLPLHFREFLWNVTVWSGISVIYTKPLWCSEREKDLTFPSLHGQRNAETHSIAVRAIAGKEPIRKPWRCSGGFLHIPSLRKIMSWKFTAKENLRQHCW